MRNYLSFLLIYLEKVLVSITLLLTGYWVLFRKASQYGDIVQNHFNWVLLIIIVISLAASLLFCWKLKKIKYSLIKVDLILVMLSLVAMFLGKAIELSSIGFIKLLNIPIGTIISTDTWILRALFIACALSIAIVQFYQILLPKIKPTKYLPWILFFTGIVLYSILCVQRHRLYHSFTMDLAGYDQAIYLLSRFKIPASSIYYIPNYIGDHFEPILLLLSPIFWLWNNVIALLIVQVVIVMSGIFPINGLAKKYIGSWAGIAFSIVYLFFIGLQYGLEFDFHTLTLVTPMLAYAIYFLDAKKNFRFWLMIFIILMSRESVALYIVFIGVFALIKKRRWIGISAILLGIIWFEIATKLLVPMLSHRPYGYLDAYHALGNSPTQIIITILTRPLYIFDIFITPSTKITTFLTLIGSLAFMPFLAPTYLILALPMLGEKFLTTDRESNWLLWWHYSSTIIAPMIAGSIMSIKWLSQKINKYKIEIISVSCVTITVMALSVSFFYADCLPWPTPLLNLTQIKFYIRDVHLGELDKILANIPVQNSVAAQDVIAPHLSHRKEIYRINNPQIPETDYVIFDMSVGHWPWSDEKFQNILSLYQQNNQYQLLVEQDRIYVFKKIN